MISGTCCAVHEVCECCELSETNVFEVLHFMQTVDPSIDCAVCNMFGESKSVFFQDAGLQTICSMCVGDVAVVSSEGLISIYHHDEFYELYTTAGENGW